MQASFAFRCGLRGYHVYQNTWSPRKDEVLAVKHEEGNLFDRYAIAAVKRNHSDVTVREKIVGHLPKEISRLVRFIILHRALVSVKVIDEAYRRSPLVQGGLEIPVLVTITMEYSTSNQAKIEKFKILCNELYQEPVNGQFTDATADILKAIHSGEEEELESTDADETDEDD